MSDFSTIELFKESDNNNYKGVLSLQANNVDRDTSVNVILTLDVDGQTTNLEQYTVTVEKADEPVLNTEGIKTFTISGNQYSTPIQVGGIGSDKEVKITSVESSTFSIRDSNVGAEGLTLSASDNTYVTTQDLSFTASLNNDSPTTGTIQLTLQIDGEVQEEKLEYELTVNNPKLNTNGLQREVTEGVTYTQNFVVEGIIPDASDTDPVVKIRAVNFNPSSALSVDTTLPITLSKNSNTNDYQGEIEINPQTVSQNVTVTLTVQVGDQLKDLEQYTVTVEKADEPELITEGIKTFTISGNEYSTPIQVQGIGSGKTVKITDFR